VSDGTELLQTTVPTALAEWAKLRAAEEHISLAAWLRQLIAQDQQAREQRGPSERARRADLVIAASVAVLPGLVQRGTATDAVALAEGLVRDLQARGYVP